ncbi:MAG: DUF2156 domain-containing protein [Ruminococcus sp.]|uniref:DUF2156 domain-containing protein n=1 Tax=Ruminococcus sp. TaxID=41978 RepID=UPI0025D59AD2|nr:phosphatidylglycerol lysyltransferase domain-containing protein [Ruminococcus sp.]MBO4867053.1 DUF2156 domain-containing protein [Ruminococcus sp.]
MFDFRKIELTDRDEINARLAVSDRMGCEYSFANNFAWHRLSDSLICLHGDFYILMNFSDGEPVLSLPAGAADGDQGRERTLSLLKELEKYITDNGDVFRVCSVTEMELEWLKKVYGDKISFTTDRGSSDYIYLSEKLITLEGKKYHGKRNHINRFMENDWSFDEIRPCDIEDCFRFAADIYNSVGDNDGSAVIEQYAIHRFLMNMDYLGLKGGILRANGEMVGFTIGEQLNSNTFVVHIEKARGDINGAYPMLCNQFAKKYASQLKYINREEDMGIEGLRRSKLSYHPEFLLHKYTVSFK